MILSFLCRDFTCSLFLARFLRLQQMLQPSTDRYMSSLKILVQLNTPVTT